MQRTVNGRHIANLGAVSLSRTSDRHAHYVLLHVTAAKHQLIRRSVAYEIGNVVEILEQRAHPRRRFIIKHLPSTKENSLRIEARQK